MKKVIQTWFAFLSILFIMFMWTGVAQSQPPDPIPWGDVIVYGSNRYGDLEMVEINLTDNTYQNVGAALLPNQAMAQDPTTGYVYYFESTNAGDQFAYWEPTSGSNIIVRTYNPAPGFYAKRMDFAPDGTLYLMDEDDDMYILDKQTGNYTLLDTVSGLVSGPYGGTGDMAFAPDGTLYVVTYENLYTVDLDTLTATLLYDDMIEISDQGVTLWTGLAYCDGQLYASHGQQISETSSLFQIDPASGATTLLFETDLILNDLTSCQPRIEVCDLTTGAISDFYIEPLNVQIAVNQAGSLDCIHMRRFNVSHPQATQPLQTGYYWDIVGLNSSGNPAADFNVSLTLPAPFTPDAFDKVCRRDESEGTWTCAASAYDDDSITRTDIVAFSAWTVGNNAGPTSLNLQSFTARRVALSPLLVALFVLSLAVCLVGVIFFRVKRVRKL